MKDSEKVTLESPVCRPITKLETDARGAELGKHDVPMDIAHALDLRIADR
jgi:hypothetical protein